MALYDNIMISYIRTSLESKTSRAALPVSMYQYQVLHLIIVPYELDTYSYTIYS